MARLTRAKHVIGTGVRAGLKKFGYELQPDHERIIDPDPFPIDAWSDEAYADWFEAHRVTDEELARQREQADSFAIKPVFSFIVPLFRTPLDYLRDVVESVMAQSYSKLELVLVNASPENEALAQAVEEYRKADERIIVVPLDRNYGITLNTDYGVTASSGDFLCFLDHDDMVEPDLLFEYVSAINDNPRLDFLYCDEDMVEAIDVPAENDGKAKKQQPDAEPVPLQRAWHYQHPLFKPDLTPELLLCKNYVIHLLTVRRELYANMPALTADFDGSQDYNLTLIAAFEARSVHHVPKVLYHWRMSANSTATNPGSKPFGRTSYRLTIQNHMDRQGIRATVITTGIAFLHNLWFKPGNAVRVSVIVPAEDDFSQTRKLIGLFKQSNSYENVEVIVVGSQPECSNIDIPGVYCVSEPAEQGSIIGAWNRGAKAAQGDFVLFLPPRSMFITAEPLEQLLGLSSIKGVGVVAPKTLYGGGENKCYGIAITKERVMPLYRGYDDDFPGYQCNLRAFQNPSAVSYEGMMTPRVLFEGLGGFDERFEGMTAAADYCVRVSQAGYRCVQTPTVKLLTDERCPFPRYDYATSTADFSEKDQELFYAKWPSWRESGDPFFNANLDQTTGYQQVPHE